MNEPTSISGTDRSLVGVWTGQVHHDGQSDPYVISFAADGTIALRTPGTVGTGTWTPEQGGRFSYDLTETFTPASGRAGQLRAHVEAHLEGTTHRGIGVARIYTPDGTLVHSTTAEFTGDRTAEATAPWHSTVGLGTSIRGRTSYPGDDDFDDACSGWLLTVDHRPAAVVIAADAGDVATAVRFAAQTRRPVAVQSTGHGVSVPADDAVLISTRELRELSVDPGANTARIGAGLRWEEVIGATAEHGLAPLSGSSGQVGVMGYLTGGGLPLTCRTYGFAASHVRSLELVTADGQVRTVSPERDPDLFWAARGAKSNFGVVTSAEIELVPLRDIYAGELLYPVEDSERASHLLRSYLGWVKEQPDEMSTSITLLRLPDVPQLPEEFRGRSLIQIHVVHTGDEAQGRTLVEPLRALGPKSDSCAMMPYSRITELHHDPKHPVMIHYRSALLDELDETAVATLASFIDPAAPPELLPGIELRHLGGALDRPPRRPHPVSTQDAAFHLWMRMPISPEQADEVRTAADQVLDRLKNWDTGFQLPGFLFDHDSGPEQVARAYAEPDRRRLAELKAEYDPANLFRVNHNILPNLPQGR